MFLVVDSATGKVVGGPEIQARGSGIEDDAFERGDPQIAGGAEPRPPRTVSANRTSCSNWSAGCVGKWVSDTYRRRPMILPVVVEV